jgi:hypothetical protein
MNKRDMSLYHNFKKLLWKKWKSSKNKLKLNKYLNLIIWIKYSQTYTRI